MTKLKKGQLVSDEFLAKEYSRLEERVKKGDFFRRKIKLKHHPDPALSDLIGERRWHILYNSEDRGPSSIFYSSPLIMHNPTLSAYLYYSDSYPFFGKVNPCFSKLPEDRALTAKPYCPIIYALKEENLDEIERELRKQDWVFF